MIAAVSVPASGSVTPKATCSVTVERPAAGSARFISSLPCFTTGFMPKIDRCSALHPFIAAPGRRDLLEHDRRLGDALAAAAVLLGDGDADPAALGHRLVELPRELVLGVAARASRRRRTSAHTAHRVADQLVIVIDGEIIVPALEAARA